MITLKKVGHLAMRVPDPERGARFYAEVLGFAVSGRADGVVFLRCGPDHHSTVFYPVAHSSPWEAHIPQRPGLHHLAFAVGSREELEQAADFLQRRGVTPHLRTREVRGTRSGGCAAVPRSRGPV
jgi:catechol 2,3-dioxygenase-like lactoylglutathione lyase family enzyme